MICRLAVFMTSQTHCLFPLLPIKLHNSSASQRYNSYKSPSLGSYKLLNKESSKILQAKSSSKSASNEPISSHDVADSSGIEFFLDPLFHKHTYQTCQLNAQTYSQQWVNRHINGQDNLHINH